MASPVPPSKHPLPPDQRRFAGPELEIPQDYKETFRNRPVASKYADPCAEASKASLDCLERAHYNRNECMDFFRAYRECKKKYIEQMKADRKAGRPTR